MKNDLPYALALGVTEERFWDACPVELKPYIRAHKITMRQNDEHAWMQGMYFYNALSVALSHFCGNKHSRYVQNPFLHNIQDAEETENLTEAQKEKYVDQVFVQLMVMQSNFNNTHKKNDDKG